VSLLIAERLAEGWLDKEIVHSQPMHFRGAWDSPTIFSSDGFMFAYSNLLYVR